jgi:hypothetical protein
LLLIDTVLYDGCFCFCLSSHLVQLWSNADGKLQKVSGRCLILSSDHYVFSLIIWLCLFRRSVNCWRESAFLQQFTDRLNKHSQSLESLEHFCTMLIYN